MEKQLVIEVKMCNGVKFVKTESVVLIRTTKRHSVITLCDGTFIEAFHSIGWFEQNLSKLEFCRCHQSHIVHFRYIESLDYTSAKVKVKGYGEVSFSRKYKPVLVNKLKAYLAQN